jgi:hypothetical protein
MERILKNLNLTQWLKENETWHVLDVNSCHVTEVLDRCPKRTLIKHGLGISEAANFYTMTGTLYHEPVLEYLASVLPGENTVEQRVEIVLDEKRGFKIKGSVDLINREDDVYRIVDFKTWVGYFGKPGGKFYESDKVAGVLPQVTAYAGMCKGSGLIPSDCDPELYVVGLDTDYGGDRKGKLKLKPYGPFKYEENVFVEFLAKAKLLQWRKASLKNYERLLPAERWVCDYCGITEHCTNNRLPKAFRRGSL